MTFEQVKSDIQRLTGSKRELAEALADKAAFMEEQLGILQGILREKGWTEEYGNGGGQYGIKKASEGDIYNTLVRNFNATIKQLADLVASAPVVDSIDDFE